MSKHTPGPWEYVRETEHMGGYPCNVSHKVKVGQELLTVGCHGYGWGEPEKEIEANAHLVAAAPELLEACKDALAFVEELDRRGIAQEWSGEGALKAAIEKAEGVGA